MADTDTQELKPKKKLNIKVIILGIPLFILQLVAVYYITATILIKQSEAHAGEQTADSSSSSQAHETPNLAQGEFELGKFIYAVEDIIVNPAGTDSKRLLLTSVGLDIPSEEQMKAIEEKEILVKDIIISVLSEKGLEQLRDASYKDSLRTEISGKLREIIPAVQVNRVYFSKYILQ